MYYILNKHTHLVMISETRKKQIIEKQFPSTPVLIYCKQ